MPDQTQWNIPLERLAHERALVMSDGHTSQEYTQKLYDEFKAEGLAEGLADPQLLLDFAGEGWIRWSDAERNAVKVGVTAVCYDEEWAEAPKSLV